MVECQTSLRGPRFNPQIIKCKGKCKTALSRSQHKYCSISYFLLRKHGPFALPCNCICFFIMLLFLERIQQAIHKKKEPPRALDVELPRFWCVLSMLFARNESHESNPYSLKASQRRGESNWCFGRKPGMMTSYLYCRAIPELADMRTYCAERILEQKRQGNASGRESWQRH